MIDRLRKRYEDLQGLLNTPMNQKGGLLDNIPQAAILGSAIYGQGIQGRDPFSALLPAVAQTTQIQKMMTPKSRPLKQAYDPKSGKNVFATDIEIKEKGLEPARTGMITTINPNTGEYTSVPVTEYGNILKKQDKATGIGTQYNVLEGFITDMKNRLPATKTGTVGAGYGLVEGLSDQFSQLAEGLGVKDTLQIENTEAIDNYLESKGFTKAAQNYATMKGSVINLGYALAKIAEPNNPRLSEGDILRQLNRINFGGSREVFAASLDNILKEEGIRAEAEIKALGGDISMFEKKKKEKETKSAIDPLNLGL
jgi:hypothetical protein|tara:strand:+ start:69 stop:1001 length:933 start_codon:yes stop_codon:yes gene_type:complete